MLGLVRGLVVDVDVGALDVGEVLELELELLGDVVGGAQGGLGVHDDVDLGDEARARVVDADGVDAEDGLGRVRQAHVRDELLGLDAGHDAHQQQELLHGGAQPDAADQHRQDDGAHGVEPPHQLRSAHRRQHPEPVDQQVVAVVLPQDVHLAVVVLDAPAVQEEAELGAERDGHRDHRREMERVKLRRRPGDQLLDREADEDQRDRRHQEREGDVAGGLEARLARREPARVHALHRPVRQDQHQIAKRIEDRVGHGGEERQGARRDGPVHLQDREHHVRRERPVHGDAVLELLLALLLRRVRPVLLHALEHALDRLVLRPVEGLDLPGVAAGADERGGLGGVSLTRRVGLDLVELLVRLEGRRQVERVAPATLARIPRLRLDVGHLGGVARHGVVGLVAHGLDGRTSAVAVGAATAVAIAVAIAAVEGNMRRVEVGPGGMRGGTSWAVGSLVLV